MIHKSAPQSFSQALPYWFIHDAAHGAHGSQDCAIVVLKDGALAVGLEVVDAEFDNASNPQLNALYRSWSHALGQLPPDTFVQSTWSCGESDQSLLQGFSVPSAGDSQSVTRLGRQERFLALQADATLRRPRLVHWIGLRGWRSLARLRASKGDISGHEALNQASDHLMVIAEQLKEALVASGVGGRWLNRKDMVRELHQAINPHLAHKAPPPALMGPGTKASLSSQLPLGFLDASASDMRMGEPPKWHRVLGVLRLPEETTPATLQKDLLLRAAHLQWKMVVTHESTQPAVQQHRLEQRRKWLYALGTHVFANHAAKRAYEQTEDVLEEVVTSKDRLLKTSITILVTAQTQQQLDHSARAMADLLYDRHVVVATLEQEQVIGWLATLPAYGYRSVHKHLLLQQTSAHLTPLSIPSRGDEEVDLLFETRQKSLESLSIRLTKRQDASAVIVGKTGSGKTFLFSNLLKYGCLDLGGQAILADIKGSKNSSYRPLCEVLGGKYIHLQDHESPSFSPFPDRTHVQKDDGDIDIERLAITKSVLAMMGTDLKSGPDDYAHSVLADVLRLLYTDPNPPNRPVILSDAISAFDRYLPRNDNLKHAASSIRERLEFWCEDPVRHRLFNTPVQQRPNSPLTVYDFQGFEQDKSLSQVLIATLAAEIEATLSRLPFTTPKLFGFDEAWAMFDASHEATQLLNRLYRTARSYGACCYLLTQSHSDIANSTAAQGILSNLGLVFLMRHQTDHDAIADLFRLDHRQQELFESLKMVPGQFSETLMVDTNRCRSQVLRYSPTPIDLWSDTSRPADVDFRRALMEQGGMGWAQAISLLARYWPDGAPSTPQAQQAALLALAQTNGAAESRPT